MARIKLHSEKVGMNRDRLYARQAELETKYPGAEIKTRRLPNYGPGYTISVHGEGAATRVQLRGHCQFCGNDQVAKSGVFLVLHGYQRPGHGWIFGRCPGAGDRPLQLNQARTEKYLADARWTLSNLQATLPTVEKLEIDAKAAYDASGEHGIYGRPTKPYKPNDARQAKYEADVAAWRAQYPLSVAYLDAVDRTRDQKAGIGQHQAQVAHFELLLSWKLLGTSLLAVEK